VVADMQGGLVPGAHVVIACADPPASRETAADAEGFFNVGGLAPGTYSVTISSPGLETYIVRDLHLKPGEVYSLPEVSLPMARTAADVTVTLTTEQIAEEELHNELQQRILGVLPNFYTSYQWDAAPLSARQKLKLTARAATDPVFLGTTAITAGIEQAQNTYPEYGGGPAGYWKRYGAAYGDAVIGRLMGSVVFSSVFHQDPRYFVMTNGSWQRRAWHAISSTVIQRGDNYHWQLGYSHLLGAATTGMIASTYHPDSSMGKLVLDGTILDLGNKAANNLIREFVLRHLAKNIPSYAKGKPPEE
jgi:Carboxypeptidase regulatory-like domain